MRINFILLLFLANFSNKAQVSILNQGNFITQTFTFNAAAGSNRLLLFFVTAEFNTTANSIISANYGGINMTQITTAAINQTGGTPNKRNQISAFYLNESQIIATAHNSVVIAFTATCCIAALESVGTTVFTLGGVDQSNPVEDSRIAFTAPGTTNNTIDANPSISAEINDRVFTSGTSSSASSNYNPVPAGYTEHADINLSNHSYCVNSLLLGTNLTTDPTITNTTPNRLAMISFEVNALIVVLPIDLLKFSASKQNDFTKLNWLTENSVNFKHFELYKSTNAYNWRSIALVQRSTNQISSKQDYEFDDYEVLNQTTYYKLKLVDNDNSYKYSRIIEVQNDKGKELDALVINDNEASALRLRLINFSSEVITAKIYSLDGKLQFEHKVYFSEVENEILLLKKLNLSSGSLYCLVIEQNQKQIAKKFIY